MLLLRFVCGATGNRTRDTRIFSPLLYQLSYGTDFLQELPYLSIGIAKVDIFSLSANFSQNIFRIYSYLRKMMLEKYYISVILPLKLEWEPCYWTDEDVKLGNRVKVMVANREYVGVVSAVGIQPDIDKKRIRKVSSVEHGMGVILPEEIELWKKVAEYYLCTVGEVYKAAYPAGKVNMEEARAMSRKKVLERRQRIIDSIDLKIDKLHQRLIKKQEQASGSRERTKARSRYLADIESIKAEIAKAFESKTHAEECLNAAMEGRTLPVNHITRPAIKLTEHQQKAYQNILRGFASEKPVLLNGVTGSGKTEIYIELAWETLKAGRNVLYLVPEIALSRQLEDRLHEHFGERLLTFHSGESSASRLNSAEIIRNLSTDKGNYIVLCTRSGLFLPHHDLGLIVVDEEHDSSYKQDSPAPRYNGRDTALILSNLHKGCNIILGSATPSLEEMYNTQVGRHVMVELNTKFHGSQEPETEIIDTKAERRKRGMHGNFSRKLIDHIRRALNDGNQTLILRSRRAWSSALQCEDCGDIQKCPHCNVSMSHHKDTGLMRCHYCGFSIQYTGKCGKCSGQLVNIGAGTQKIEEEAAALFPEARIARLDSDTAQNKTYEAKTIRAFAKGEIDILIGTQIISKGFDFSNLSLVAVISADTLLSIQDFRADEKALHLIEQFRGRCGRRGKKGLLVIQTSQPEHPVYGQLAKNCSNSSERLMMERKEFNFPPYSRIIELTVKDAYEDRASRMSFRLMELLAGKFGTDASCQVTGPYTPVVDKISGQYIRKIRICLRKDRKLSANKTLLKTSVEVFEKEHRYENHIILDVDPS